MSTAAMGNGLLGRGKKEIFQSHPFLKWLVPMKFKDQIINTNTELYVVYTFKYLQCTARCGKGLQYRRVECRTFSGKVAKNCKISEKPRSSQECDGLCVPEPGDPGERLWESCVWYIRWAKSYFTCFKDTYICRINLISDCKDVNKISYCPLVKRFRFCDREYFRKMCCKTCSKPRG